MKRNVMQNTSDQKRNERNIKTEAAINIIDTFCVHPVFGKEETAVGVALADAARVAVGLDISVGEMVSVADTVALNVGVSEASSLAFSGVVNISNGVGEVRVMFKVRL